MLCCLQSSLQTITTVLITLLTLLTTLLLTDQLVFLLQFPLFQSVSPGQLDGDAEHCSARQSLGQLKAVEAILVTDLEPGPGVEEEDGDVVMFSNHGVVKTGVAVLIHLIRVLALLQQLLDSHQAAPLDGLDDGVVVHLFDRE